MSMFGMLASGNFIIINRDVVKSVGLEAAVMLSELADEERYYEENGLLDGRWFYSTVQNVEMRTDLSKRKQLNALKRLEDAGIVKCEVRGMPAKRYFSLNPDGLQDIFNSKPVVSNRSSKLERTGPTRCLKTSQQDGAKQANKMAQNGTERITPFKKNEVKNNKIINKDCLDVINYLNEKTGRRYKATENYNRLINGRKSEGHTVEEMKQVIDIKCDEWSGTDMEKFLRPSTLFAPSHFEDYLNQKPVKKKTSLFEGVDLSEFEGEWKE